MSMPARPVASGPVPRTAGPPRATLLVLALAGAICLTAATTHANQFTIFQPGEEPGTNGTLPWAIEQSNLLPGLEHRLVFDAGMANRSVLLTEEMPHFDLGTDGLAEIDVALAERVVVRKRVPNDPNEPIPDFDILTVKSGTVRLIDLQIGGGDFVVEDADATLVLQYRTDFAIEDDIRGSGRLVKEGAGILLLSGQGLYSGGTEVREGELRGNVTSLRGDFEIADGALLNFAFSDNNGGADFVFSGNITGAGKLIKSGLGTLSLEAGGAGAVVDHTGGTEIQRGTLKTTPAVMGASDVQILSDGIFELSFTGLVAQTYSGSIAGAGRLKKTGSGILVLDAVNSYTGGLEILGGHVRGRAASLPGDISVLAGSSVTFDQPMGSNEVHDGTISGLGDLVKLGSGRVHLTGSTSLAGGIDVIAGTLAGNAASLNGNASGIGPLSIQAGAELELLVTSDEGFSRPILAQGDLRKTGAARLSFTAPQAAMDGMTFVDAGTLQLDAGYSGSSGSPAGEIQVGPGGTLAASHAPGTVISASRIVVEGTLLPGRSLGSAMNVVGDVELASGSTLAVRVAADGSGTLLDVSAGNLTLGGGSLDVRIEPGDYGDFGDPGVTVEVARTSASLIGSFASPPSPAYAFASVTATEGASNVLVTVKRNSASIAGFGNNANQRATAVAVSELLASPDPDADLLDQSLIVLTVDAVPALLDELAAEPLTALATARILDGQRVARLFARRFTARRFEAGQAPPLSIPRRVLPPRADAPVDAGPEPPPWAEIEERGFASWIEPLGGFGELDGGDAAKSISTAHYGLAGGFDYRLPLELPGNSRLRVGAGLGYLHDATRSEDGLAHAWANSYQLHAFAAWAARGWHVGLGQQYAYSDMTSRREVAVGSVDREARAHFGGHQSATYGEIGLHLGNPRIVQLHPYFGAQYTRLTQDAFTESGAGSLALEIGSLTIDSMTTQAGLRVSKVMTLGGRYGIEPELRAGWSFEHLERAHPLDARFSGASAGTGHFRTRGAAIDAHRFDLGVGYVMRLGDTKLLSFDYAAELSERETAHGFSLSFKLHW